MTVKIRPYRKGGYEVDIMIRLSNGQPYRERRKSPYTAKAASLRWGSERERHLLIHGPTPRGREAATTDEKEVTTFAQFVPRYIEGYLAANGAKPSVVRTRKSHLRVHLVPAFGDKPIDQISREDVQRLKAKLSKLNNHTINNVLVTFNTFMNCAAHFGLVEDPIKGKHLRVVRKSRDFFDFEEYDRLIQAAATLGPERLAVVLLAGDAGLRSGEIRGLHWSSIDWKQSRLTVERAEYEGKFYSPKHDRIRVIPMTGRLATVLGQLDRRHPLVVSQSDGAPFTVAMVKTRVRQGLRAAKLRLRGPHTLRHTFCSHLAMRGVPARVIMQLAGHAKLETTQGYMHLSPGAVETAIAALEEPPPRREIPRRSVGGEGGGDMMETARRLH